MSKTFKTIGAIAVAVVIIISMAVSSFADFYPAQLEDFIYTFSVKGSCSSSNSFDVLSAGYVTITGQVTFTLPAKTPSQTVSAYVYIYNSSGYQVASIWLDTSIRENSTDGELKSLTYSNSKQLSLPVGTYTVRVTTSCTSSDIVSDYVVIFA